MIYDKTKQKKRKNKTKNTKNKKSGALIRLHEAMSMTNLCLNEKVTPHITFIWQRILLQQKFGFVYFHEQTVLHLKASFSSVLLNYTP